MKTVQMLSKHSVEMLKEETFNGVVVVAIFPFRLRKASAILLPGMEDDCGNCVSFKLK